MICKIADFVVEFKNPSKAMSDYLKDYTCDGTPYFSIEVSKEEIEHARSLSKPNTGDLQAETTAVYEKFLSQIPLDGAMFLHASLIDVKGVGIAFAALSGTGKTTHTLLWQKLLGDKMQIINGDKPIIRFSDNIPYGYGTPWNGKERLGINGKTALKHLCFIERSDNNRCSKITPDEALAKIFNQIFIPSDPQAASDTLALLNRLLTYCTLWKIECNTDIAAAKTAYNAIFEENENEA